MSERECVCMCVCVCVCVRACMHAYCMLLCVCVCVQVYMQACMACMCILVCWGGVHACVYLSVLGGPIKAVVQCSSCFVVSLFHSSP